jgi:hypothetical protein
MWVVEFIIVIRAICVRYQVSRAAQVSAKRRSQLHMMESVS